MWLSIAGVDKLPAYLSQLLSDHWFRIIAHTLEFSQPERINLPCPAF